MKSLFGALTSRIEDYRTLRAAYDRIDRTKVAALIDLSACFTDAAAADKCNLSGMYEMRQSRIMGLITAWASQGMYLDLIPDTLAKPKTAPRIKEHAEAMRGAMDALVVLKSDGTFDTEGGEEFKLQLQSMMIEAARFNIMYVGDFLDLVEEVVHPYMMMKFDALQGHTDPAMKVLEALRTLHDYSEHTPNRPPPPPNKPQRREESAVPLFPGLSPVGARG